MGGQAELHARWHHAAINDLNGLALAQSPASSIDEMHLKGVVPHAGIWVDLKAKVDEVTADNAPCPRDSDGGTTPSDRNHMIRGDELRLGTRSLLRLPPGASARQLA